jgi:hypothetical protein
VDALAQFILTERFDLVWSVLGNPKTGQFLLVPPEREKTALLTEGENLRARAGSYEFIGCFAHRTADCYSDLWHEDRPGFVFVMVKAFGAFVRALVERRSPGFAEVTELERVLKLPDPRSN